MPAISISVADHYLDLLRATAPERAWPDALAPALRQRVVEAAAAWPGLALALDDFVRMLATRLASDQPVEQTLAALDLPDLYLACACAAGDPRALAAFEERCGRAIALAIASSGATPAERADLGQVVRQRLLVAPADGDAPRIASYSGRGALTSWVRVVATREAARMLPRARRESAAEDAELARLIAGGDDPEIGYLKRLYRAEFARAFQAAVAALDDRARVVLRQHLLDDLTIDQLAALHAVHRATVARWIQAAREDVVTGTQRELTQRLRLSRAELASVIRLIQSQLDMSLSGALRVR